MASKFIQINVRLTQEQITEIEDEQERHGIGSFSEAIRFVIRSYFNPEVLAAPANAFTGTRHQDKNL